MPPPSFPRIVPGAGAAGGSAGGGDGLAALAYDGPLVPAPAARFRYLADPYVGPDGML
jgi:hypothetical protein